MSDTRKICIGQIILVWLRIRLDYLFRTLNQKKTHIRNREKSCLNFPGKLQQWQTWFLLPLGCFCFWGTKIFEMAVTLVKWSLWGNCAHYRSHKCHWTLLKVNTHQKTKMFYLQNKFPSCPNWNFVSEKYEKELIVTTRMTKIDWNDTSQTSHRWTTRWLATIRNNRISYWTNLKNLTKHRSWWFKKIDDNRLNKNEEKNIRNLWKYLEKLWKPETMKQHRTKLLEKMNPFLIPQVEGADSTSRIMNLKCHWGTKTFLSLFSKLWILLNISPWKDRKLRDLGKVILSNIMPP